MATYLAKAIAEDRGTYHVSLRDWEVFYKESFDPDPWTQEDRVIGLEECFDLSDVCVEPSLDWGEAYKELPSWDQMVEDYEEENGEEWTDKRAVVTWAYTYDQSYAREINLVEDSAYEDDVSFLETLILKEVEVDSLV